MTEPAFGDGPVARFLWPLLASLAGSIASVGIRNPWEGLGWRKTAMAMFVAFSFAYFVGPWAVKIVFLGKDAIDIKAVGAVYWVMATGSNYLIAVFIKKVGVLMGDNSSENRP